MPELVIYYNHKEKEKEIAKMIVIKVSANGGLTYFVEKHNKFSAQMYRIGHILRQTGYRTEIVTE